LTNDTKGSSLMTYDEIAKFRVGRTYQYSDVFIEKRLRHKRSDTSDNGAIWSFTKASIPVHSGGPEKKARSTGSRREGSLYCKTTQEFGCFYKMVFEFFRGFIEQHSYASPKGISQKKGAWPGGVVKERSRCSTVMIDCAIRNFHRFIDCWSRRRFGRSTRMNRN
jgi:hypothetical protein